MEKKGGVCIIFLLRRVSTGLEDLCNSVEANLSGRIQDWGKQSQKLRVHIRQKYTNITHVLLIFF